MAPDIFGRMNRLSYLTAVVFAFALMAGLERALPSDLKPFSAATGSLLLIAGIARLHDLGLSGWWWVGVVLILPAYMYWLGLMDHAIWVVTAFMLTIGIIPSQSMLNRFGAKPARLGWTVLEATG
jgi:uncharacterized membrane protein YhaH (DUF805 family)